MLKDLLAKYEDVKSWRACVNTNLLNVKNWSLAFWRGTTAISTSEGLENMQGQWKEFHIARCVCEEVATIEQKYESSRGGSLHSSTLRIWKDIQGWNSAIHVSWDPRNYEHMFSSSPHKPQGGTSGF